MVYTHCIYTSCYHNEAANSCCADLVFCLKVAIKVCFLYGKGMRGTEHGDKYSRGVLNMIQHINSQYMHSKRRWRKICVMTQSYCKSVCLEGTQIVNLGRHLPKSTTWVK